MIDDEKAKTNGTQLPNVQCARNNQGHLGVESQRGEEERSIVDEAIYARKLRFLKSAIKEQN